MKIAFLVLIVVLSVIALPARSPQAPEPLTKGQIMDLVKAGMEAPELVKLIQAHGVDFDLTDDYLQALRQAGAQEPVIQSLRAARPKPLSKDQVLQLVVGHVPNARAAMLVRQHGVDFLADEEYLKTLRLAGADEELIAALREASKAVTAELVVETSPDAEVFLDGELQGTSGAQGELALKTKPGVHTLKVSLKGKKDFEQSVTLGARQATKIEAHLEDLTPTPGQVREDQKDGLKYVWIPPGTFRMGCSPGDNACFDDEKPAHDVTITKGFWMGQTHVTVAAYQRFATATGRQMPPVPDFNHGWVNENMPIVDVSWDDAQAYCGWMGGRLPAEAEWEYAARGGSMEPRYGPVEEIAWYVGNSGKHPHDVAQKRPNGFGLYDMLGNVLEWVKDFYKDDYYQSSPAQDPSGPATAQDHVLRGGSWLYLPENVRASRRIYNPSNGNAASGFRCGR